MRLLFGALFFIIWPIFAKRQTENETTQKTAAMAVHEKVVRNSTLLMPSAESKRERARILVAYSLDEDSHLGSLMPMINRLASAGHQVHILHVTSENRDRKFGPNIHEIRIQLETASSAEKLIKELGALLWTVTFHSAVLPLVYAKFSTIFGRLLKGHSAELIEVLNDKWDLLIVDEIFSMHGYNFAHIFSEYNYNSIPYVVASTSNMMDSTAYANAIGNNWAMHPSTFSPTPNHATDGFHPNKFSCRLVHVLEMLGDLGANYVIENFLVGPLQRHLANVDKFSFLHLYQRSQLSTVDAITRLSLPRSEVREVIQAGAHCNKAPAPEDLPEDYRQFVGDPNSEGTVYAAFGSLIRWDFAPSAAVNAIFDAFERLPQFRFIFSFNGEMPIKRKFPAHIRIVNWAPQLALLHHPKTKVFFTHGGLKSLKESLCSKTPMLVLPFFADQNHNAIMVINFGIGLALNKYNVNVDEVQSSLKELVGNPAYSERAQQLQRVFLDSGPVAALDEAEFYIGKIIRKGKERHGRHFFKRKGTQLNFLEFFHFDLLILLISIVLIMSKM